MGPPLLSGTWPGCAGHMRRDLKKNLRFAPVLSIMQLLRPEKKGAPSEARGSPDPLHPPAASIKRAASEASGSRRYI